MAKNKKNIIILNDGTDEMFNLNLIQAHNWEDFLREYLELFGGESETDRTYYLAPTFDHAMRVCHIMNSMYDEGYQQQLVWELLEDRFITSEELEKLLP